MRRDVEASTKVRAPIERVRQVLIGDPGVAIADRVRPDERQARRFHSTLAVEIGGGGVHHDVVIELRVPHSDEHSVTLPLCWHGAGHHRLFPAFEGELEASGDELGSTLTLRGAYTVPLGPVGAVGDQLAGKRLAFQSLTAFLEQTARRLDAEVARRFEGEGWHPAPYPVSVRDVGPETTGAKKGDDMASYGIFGPSPGRCWECGSPALRAVSDGYETNFVCPSCGACWHVVLGHVHRVDPSTCPGCDARSLCSPTPPAAVAARAGTPAASSPDRRGRPRRWHP